MKWSEQALDDLDAVCLFIVRDAPNAARQFVSEIFTTTDRLQVAPRMGRVVPEFNRDDIRELIFGNYRIIYRYSREMELIEILTLYHGARILDIEF